MGAVLNLTQPGGGGGGRIELPLSPGEVYARTRPADWLELPEPGMGEAYMLFHIPKEGSALCALSASCTGSFTVAVGTVSGGAFVQGASGTVASGGVWEHEFDAEDYGNETSGGMRQAVIKLSGQGITSIAPAAHSARAQIMQWNIVDIRCLLPDGALFLCGGQNARSALTALRYFSGGGGKLAAGTGSGTRVGMFQFCESLLAAQGIDTAGQEDMSAMFSNCPSLIAAPELDTSSAEDVSSMFLNCAALIAAPELDLSSAVTLNGLFRGCGSLSEAPDIDAPLAGNAQNLFTECGALRALGEVKLPAAASLAAAFQNCTALGRVERLKIAAATNLNVAFSNCALLGGIRLDPAVTGWAGAALSFANCAMGHAALSALLESLPSVSAGTLTLTGNRGAGELTAAEISAAEAKGWTVTI